MDAGRRAWDRASRLSELSLISYPFQSSYDSRACVHDYYAYGDAWLVVHSLYYKFAVVTVFVKSCFLALGRFKRQFY